MDKMKILMAASEAIPYMKTGGLADVVGSLPKYFDKDRYDVRVILPKYKCMDDKLLPQLKFVCHFYVNLNWRRQYVGIFTSQYDGVTYYLSTMSFTLQEISHTTIYTRMWRSLLSFQRRCLRLCRL